MYLSYFGLNQYPFLMTPDPRSLFLTAQHREAVAGLGYAVLYRKGLLVLSGEVGTGKSTVLARVLSLFPERVHCRTVRHPTLAPNEFIEMVMLDFGITDIPQSKAQRLRLLEKFLLDAQAKDQIPVLIIDEAHKLSREVMEEVRLLGNLDTPNQKLLQIVMAGQTELDDLLARDDLRQLKQRVAVRLTLQALGASEIENYIRFRWTHAGGTPEHPFRAEAIASIFRWSGGIPRLINSICDNSLLLAFSAQSSLVENAHVQQVVRDLDLARATEATPAPVVKSEPPARLIGQLDVAPVVEKIPEIRVPQFLDDSPKQSRLNRWATKLGLA